MNSELRELFEIKKEDEQKKPSHQLIKTLQVIF